MKVRKVSSEISLYLFIFKEGKVLNDMLESVSFT